MLFCLALNNRMYYPVYPASIPIDTKNYANMEFDEVPEVMFFPSTLSTGIKVNIHIEINKLNNI